MRLPAALESTTARFDSMSVRERGLIAIAALATLIMVWTVALFDPLTARRVSLSAELDSLQQSIIVSAQTLDETTLTDPVSSALAKEEQLRKQLADINARLASKSAGLIPPERMVQVIQDVLARQHGVTLISLHNKPVTTLMPAGRNSPSAATPASESFAANSAGLYVHPVELVIEGPYLDILAYLHALEALPWRLYWKLLDLETTHHPTNRVRIELNTLSMDKDWIGV